MHGYLRSIGFKGIMDKAALRELLREVIECPDEQKFVSLGVENENIVELKKEFIKGMGIVVHGYYLDDDTFHMEYYIPYLDGCGEAIEEDITVTRHISRESFAGVCEDMRIGATLIYYLNNPMEYIERTLKDRRSYFRGNVTLSGLSASGTILLPVNKNEKQKEKHKIANMNRRKLISEAKMGDESAIESLTIEDLDTYTRISRRIQKEDVFSIVDSSFMPYGVECDQYSIMGDILEIKECINSYSGEAVVYLMLDCNDFKISVTINKEDITGEPTVGMRFRGPIWLQGRVEYS